MAKKKQAAGSAPDPEVAKLRAELDALNKRCISAEEHGRKEFEENSRLRKLVHALLPFVPDPPPITWADMRQTVTVPWITRSGA